MATQQQTQSIGATQVRMFQPPKGFNPLTASDQDLQLHGFPHRPNKAKSPKAAAKWEKAFSNHQMLTAVTPKLTELKHRHRPNKRLRPKEVVNATSNNWSGSVLFIGDGDRFDAISGQWTVPSAYSPSPGDGKVYYSSAWLGIDGDGSADVMQAGTECDSDGTCYAWFEWFPNPSVQIDPSVFPVRPGDVTALSLYAPVGSGNAYMSMANLTSKVYTNLSFSAPQGTVLVGDCAEAIIERPSINGGIAELPRYGEVYFDEVSAYTTNGNEFDICFGTPINMVADDGVTVISAPTFEGNPDMISCTYTGP